MTLPTQATADHPSAEEGEQVDTATGQARHRRPRWFLGSPAIAIAVWVVGAPMAFVLPSLQPYDPLRMRAWLLALAPLFLGVVAFALLSRRGVNRPWLAPAAAGSVAVWTIFTLRIAIHGTPAPFGGLIADSGRLVAAATRYQASPGLADAWIPGLGAEYPPLFPWLIGRTAALLGTPAWRLVADFEIVFVSLSVLVAYLLWRRLLPEWVALTVTVATFLPAAMPAKAYQTVTLAIFIPWLLATFGRPPRGRWHWLASGLLAGFVVLTYYGWMLWGLVAILTLAWSTWRAEENRRAYLAYLAKVIGVAIVVAGVYVVPYVWASASQAGQTVGDLNPDNSMVAGFFPFLDVPLLPIGALQFVGLMGLIWLRRTVWWAPGLLALVISAFLYRLVFTFVFVATEHSGLSTYAMRLYSAVLTIAGVLVVVHATPRVLERLSVTPPREVLVVTVTLLVAWCGYNFSKDMLPGSNGAFSDYAQLALQEPRPDANKLYTDVHLTPTPWFPVDAVRGAVVRAYGSAAPSHVSLSADERLYAYLPWAGYAVNDRGAAAGRARMIDRYAEIHRLALTTDPNAFAWKSAHTTFGPIDVFVLRKGNAGWEWAANIGFNAAGVTEVFHADQFATADWTVTDISGSDFVVITRRP